MLELKDSDKVTLTISPKDAKGKPAKLDGIPVWTVDAANVAGMVVSADGLSVEINAGDPGTARVAVSADGDMGPGVTTLAGFIDISVIPGAAVTIDITPGTPTPQ